MQVLITGAEGFLGRVLTSQLTTDGYNVTAVVRSNDRIAGNSRARFAVADLRDRDSLLSIPGRTSMDAVIHLGARKHIQGSTRDPLAFYESNTTGTINLLRAIEGSTQQPLVVFASTMSVYGNQAAEPDETTHPEPSNPYASSKLAGENIVWQYAESRDASAALLRFANLAGGVANIGDSGGGIIPKVLMSAKEGTLVPINGDGSAIRDYLHVADAARAIRTVLDRADHHGDRRLYNVGRGEGAAVRDVLERAEKITGRSILVDRRPPVPEASRVVASIARITSDLDWRPSHSLDRIIGDAWAAMPAG